MVFLIQCSQSSHSSTREKMIKSLKISSIHKREKETVTLSGELHQCNKSEELVLVCHGFIEDMDTYLLRTVCEMLNHKGINAFRFNFTGYGNSEGEFQDSNYTNQKSDLKAVIKEFHKRGYQIKSVFGHSMGGSVALLVGTEETTIESIVLLAPRIFPLNHSVVTDSGTTVNELIYLAELMPIPYWPKEKKGDSPRYRKEIEKRRADMELIALGKLKDLPAINFDKPPYPISKDYLMDIKKFSTLILESIRRICVPILFVHGKEDTLVNIEESITAYEIANEPKDKWFPEAGHFFERRDKDNYIIRNSKYTEDIISGIIDKWQMLLSKKG